MSGLGFRRTLKPEAGDLGAGQVEAEIALGGSHDGGGWKG